MKRINRIPEGLVGSTLPGRVVQARYDGYNKRAELTVAFEMDDSTELRLPYYIYNKGKGAFIGLVDGMGYLRKLSNIDSALNLEENTVEVTAKLLIGKEFGLHYCLIQSATVILGKPEVAYLVDERETIKARLGKLEHENSLLEGRIRLIEETLMNAYGISCRPTERSSTSLVDQLI